MTILKSLSFSQKYLVSGLAAALLVRLAFISHFYGHPVNTLNVDLYTTLGASLVERGEFSAQPGLPCLETTPGFPIWIAILYFVFGTNPLVVLLFNALLGTATCGLAYLIAKRLFSQRAGYLALTFWAFYPYSIYYSGWTYRETFLTFLVAALLWCLLEWSRRPTMVIAAASGTLAAWLGLTNPVSLIFVAFAPATLLIRYPRRYVALHLAVYYMIVVMLYLPWPIRNRRVFGYPLLTNIHGAIQFYQGLTVPAEAFGTEDETKILSADAAYQKGLTLMSRNQAEGYVYLKQEAMRLVKTNPWGYARAVIHRFYKLWRLVPYRRQYTYDYRKIFWASLFSDGWIIPAGFIGMLAFRKRWPELLPLYAAVGLWSLAYALVFAIIRFRLPVMMIPIVFAMGWLDSFLPAGTKNHRVATP